MTDAQLNVLNQKQATHPENDLNRWLRVGPVSICLLLAAITFAVYWPVAGYDFINFDDPDYVTSNSHVQSGLNGAGVVWAFTTGHASNWHPLTWLSHMMDCQCFGLRPGWHHLINLIFHAANAVLIFTLFRRMTSAPWRSAFVAALFALHPLHVESVAWISERKDVLSTFFGLLSLIFYTQYAKSEVCNSRAAIRNYLLAWFLFACSLMSKPMLVTLPFVMLLLDYWPLARFGQGTTFWRFVWEKIPFLVLGAASSYITVVVQQAGGAVMPLSIGARIANAFVSYACYVRDTFWPTVLALPYPHPGEWPMAQVTVATVFVLGISIIVVWFGRRYPYLFWGWTWFLGTMIPVIGLVQVGGQARADRYTYIPLIGVFVMISWGLGEFATKWHWKRPIIIVCATLILTACALRTSDQLAYWSNTELLFRHTLSVTRDNYLALKYLGFQFASEGRLDEAVAYYRDSLRIRPGFGDTLNDFGNVLVQKKQYAEAEDQFQTALRVDPGFLPAHFNFANLLITLGRTNEAIEHFETVLRSKPDHSATRYQFGRVMTATGRQQEAIIQFKTLLRLEPNYPDARHRLGSVLSDLGRWDDAILQLRLAAKQKPNAPDVENDLAVALSKSGLFDEAIIHFRRVTQLSPNVASAHNNLANALVEAGKLSEAMGEYHEALRLNPNAFMTHVNLAFLLVKLDRQDEAILHLNEALRLKPDCEQAKEQLRKLRP